MVRKVLPEGFTLYRKNSAYTANHHYDVPNWKANINLPEDQKQGATAVKPLALTALASVLSMAALSSTALAATSGTQTVVETTHGWVSYHSGPGLSKAIVGRLQLGDEAPLVQKVNAYWYEIHWKNQNVYITTNSNYTKLASVPLTTSTSATPTTTTAPSTTSSTPTISTATPTTVPSTATPSTSTLSSTTTPSAQQYVETINGWVSYHSAALLSSPVVGQLHLGDNAPLVKKVNAYWYEINWNNQDVYITTSPTYTKVVTLSAPSTGSTSTSSSSTTAPASPSTPTSTASWQTQADKVIQTAKTQLGVPYLWGHQEPGVGFDCSNFVAWSYKTALSIDFSGSSQTQRNSVGTPVALSDIREGDLLFFATKGDPSGGGHVGIYMGNGQVIQEGGGWGKVTIEPLSGTWLGTNLVFARRVIN